MSPGEPTNGDGEHADGANGVPAPDGHDARLESDQKLEKMLDRASAEAVKQERADRLDSDEPSGDYPLPLPAGPQAYLNPRHWRGHREEGYGALLRLMEQLDAQRAGR